MYVAIAVLTAFKGPCPPGRECCHGDGDKRNNTLKNLRWDTRKNNHADKVVHGTTNRGERSPTAKLKASDVRRIRIDARKHTVIAAQFNVSPTLVYRIKNLKAWKHV